MKSTMFGTRMRLIWFYVGLALIWLGGVLLGLSCHGQTTDHFTQLVPQVVVTTNVVMVPVTNIVKTTTVAVTNPPAAPNSPPILIPGLTNSGGPTMPVITNLPTLAETALAWLPYWDPTITNGPGSFKDKELEIETSLAYKALNGIGATPFADFGGNYFFTKNFGGGGDILTFNNGAGGSIVDGGSVYLEARAINGNVCGYALGGFWRDFTQSLNEGRIGLGVEFRYQTGLFAFVDSSYLIALPQATSKGAVGDGWLTRVGIGLHF